MASDPTCGVAGCASSCHRPGTTGRYCAPTRCYCAGCPAYVPLPPAGQPIKLHADQTVESWAREQLRTTARLAREAGDLHGALVGDPIAPPQLKRSA